MLIGVACLCTGAAWSGRPLIVDDAEVSDPGHGQVESWYARPAHDQRRWTTALGVGLPGKLEFGAEVQRNFEGPSTNSALQLKMQITSRPPGGCNLGAVLGRSHESRGGGDGSYFNGLVSCDMRGGLLHLNLGAERPDGSSLQPTWGVAEEFGLWAATTLHVEGFGQRHARPTWRAGLKYELTTDLHVDGTLGRWEHGTTGFSLGLRLGF